MDEIYEIHRKISKPSTDYCVVPFPKQSYDLVACIVGLLRSLNMNTPEFALSRL